LWAIGRYDLRLSEAEFWALTPCEFQLLLDRNKLHVQWQESMAALHPMLYAERHRDKTKRRQPYSLQDFTLTGLAKAALAAEQAAKKAPR
jgi:hypothetical protein